MSDGPVVGLDPDTPVTVLDLPPRVLNRLKREHITTIGALVACDGRDLLDMRNLGVGSYRQVVAELARYGLALAPLEEGAPPLPETVT